jgi:hypothetical protein
MSILPSLEELTALNHAEIEALIRVNLPPGHTFTFAEEAGEPWGVWTAEVSDMEGNVVFTSSYPDRRLTLLNAYGFVWRSRYKPQNPVWQRRRDDLREKARKGIMHLPGADAVPDPDDLNPGSVYDLGSKERT